MEKITISEIINNIDVVQLRNLLVEYAQKDSTFKQFIVAKYSPQNISTTSAKDYVRLVLKAFGSNQLQSGNRYRGWENFGFDAMAVREDLEPLLEEVDYFLKYNNNKAAVKICKDLISTIQQEWEEQFDEEGDVQVIYDEAIEKLEKMLKDKILSTAEKEELFEWYKEESMIENYQNIGLNTSFNVLRNYFVDSKEMLRFNLELLTQKINNSGSDYEKESLTIQKIEILKTAGNLLEMNRVIDENLGFAQVRKLRLESLMTDQDYEQAQVIIKAGIAIAEKQAHHGTLADWKDDLLKIYLLQKNEVLVLSLTEDLLYSGRGNEQKNYYKILKEHTDKQLWPTVLDRILRNLKSSSGLLGFNQLRAEILVEHEMWKLLFEQCKKAGVNYLVAYEKQLRPQFNLELYQIYLQYIEKEATITHQESYENVARYMKHLKTFDGGKEKVKELIAQYRILYKRRKNMMLILDKV